MTLLVADKSSYAESILESERWISLPAKWLLLALGLISTHFVATYRVSTWFTGSVVAYSLLNVLFTYLFGYSRSTAGRTSGVAYFVSYMSDIAFASEVIYYSADFSSETYLLFALLALKSAIYYPVWPEVLVLPFSLGPLYALILRLSLGSWYFLTETFFLFRYAVLLAVVLAAVYLGWLNERSRRREDLLRGSLAERTLELDAKTRATQQMAANLGNRVLELRTLQEGIKAINSALALEDVLRLIVANASQVLRGARCSATLLDDEHGETVTMASADWRPDALASAGLGFDGSAASWVVHNGKSALVRDVKQGGRFASVAGLPISALISVPLFLGDEAIGALIATSPDRDAFTDEDLNLLSAFADQAVVAVTNARLYEQLVEEQKQTAQLYQHVEERRNELEAILRGIGDGVIVADTDLNLLLMNPVATRIFHVRPDVTSSRALHEVVPHQELVTLFQDALGGEERAIVREISLPHPQESETGLPRQGKAEESVYQALASPILGVGSKVRGVVILLRDITSQKELERMKSNFLSVVSHELKTPLHSIKGFVEIILMGKTGAISDTQADFLGTVRDQTAHLQNLIDDLLEFSRLDSGQVKLRLTEVSLSEVARAVVHKLKPFADQEQIQLVNSVTPDIDTIQADRMRIEQVLTNLVHNAIKFTPASGTVTLDATDLGEEIQVSVADTGIGIEAPALSRIFDRFYQVDSGSTRHYRGTGLGLTICKHIVEYHRGRIWAESQEGQGSTFFFVLPKRLEAEEELLLDFLSLPKDHQREQR
jgi:signal transduction histidine kinase